MVSSGEQPPIGPDLKQAPRFSLTAILFFGKAPQLWKEGFQELLSLPQHLGVLTERVLFFRDASGQLSRAQKPCLLQIKIPMLNDTLKLAFVISHYLFEGKLWEYGVTNSSLHYISNSFVISEKQFFNVLFQIIKGKEGCYYNYPRPGRSWLHQAY